MHTVDATLRTSGPHPQNIPIDIKTVDLYRLPCPSYPLADDLDDPRRSKDLAASIIEAVQGTEPPNTVLLPDTEQGRAAADAINRLTAARSVDYAAIERRVMQHVAALVTRREARNDRRRSRQCRGPRARNYTRANARAKLGASATGEASVFVDAVKSGAYAAASRKAVA